MSRAAESVKEMLGNVGRLQSGVGGFVPGSHVMFRGKDLHQDLQDIEWADLYIFGITGRRYSAGQLRLLQTIWSYTSYPDARLWNNRVAALAGTVRSTGNLGVAAALAVSEAAIYGRGIDIRAIDFQLRLRAVAEQGGDLLAFARAELTAKRSIAGYGRPLTSADERMAPTLKLARSLELAEGSHVRLGFQLEEMLLAARLRLRMNYGGLVAALSADLGFSPTEYYHFMFPAFLAGMLPCYIEAVQRPEGMLFPLPCSQVQYEGVAGRTWRPAGTSTDANQSNRG